jgi:hypothetical protein
VSQTGQADWSQASSTKGASARAGTTLQNGQAKERQRDTLRILEKKGNLGAEKGEEENNGSRQIMEDTAGQGHSAKDSPKVTQCMPCRIPKGKVGKMS